MPCQGARGKGTATEIDACSHAFMLGRVRLGGVIILACIVVGGDFFWFFLLTLGA